MRKLFVSYARQNKAAVDQLVEHLAIMGYETWVDVSLRGGQDWWEEILDRIAESDVFVTVVSVASLKSTACAREFDWAEALGKPVLPVLIEPLPATAFPRRISRRQITDYSDASLRDRAALRLQGGLGTLPRAPALPQPLPVPPEAPLSYLTDLVDLVGKVGSISHADQHQIVIQLEQALNAIDPEERRGARDILDRLGKRPDLYADVDRTIDRLKRLEVQIDEVESAAPADQLAPPPTAEVGRATGPAPGASPSTRPEHDPAFAPHDVAWQPSGTGGPPPKPVSYNPSGVHAWPPTSTGRLIVAALIDIVPVLVVLAVAYAVAVATPTHGCSWYGGYEPYCYPQLSLIGGIAAIIAAVIMLAYSVWNWIYRQSRTGATIGQSAIQVRMLTAGGWPPGFPGMRVARLTITVLVSTVIALVVVLQLASWTIGSPTNIPSTGWTGTAPS